MSYFYWIMGLLFAVVLASLVEMKLSQHDE